MPDILYYCDPEKNTTCNKRSCFINGGVCNRTHKLEFAKQPVTTVTLLFGAPEKDADLFKEKNMSSSKQKAKLHPYKKDIQ